MVTVRFKWGDRDVKFPLEEWISPPRVGDLITLTMDGAPIMEVVEVHWDAPERRDFVTVHVREWRP